MTTTLKHHHDLPWDRVRWAATAFVLGAVLAVGLTVLLTDDTTTTSRPAASAASADSLTSASTVDRVSADAADRRSSIQAVPGPRSESPGAVDHRAEAERTARIALCTSGPVSPDAAERCLANR